MRTILPKLSENLGQQIVIDNRPGGGSTIGSEIVARAPADGYTLLMIDTALTVNPSLDRSPPDDTVKDFAPVSLAATAPVIFVVHPTLPVRSLKELLALARAKPGQIVYASGGNGTSTHLAGELLKQVAKIDMVHVPYKGIGPAISDLLGGHVQAMFTGISSAKQHVYANKLERSRTAARHARLPCPRLQHSSSSVGRQSTPARIGVPWRRRQRRARS